MSVTPHLLRSAEKELDEHTLGITCCSISLLAHSSHCWLVGRGALRFSREGGVLAEPSAALGRSLRRGKAETFEVKLGCGWIGVCAISLAGGFF